VGVKMILLLWIALVVGAIFLFKEHRDRLENRRNFKAWLHHLDDAPLEERREAAYQLYFRNGYEVDVIDDRTLEARKRHFSFGWALIGFGFLGVGLLIYLLWYYRFQKPEITRIELDKTGGLKLLP
jgi:hypothetical protein